RSRVSPAGAEEREPMDLCSPLPAPASPDCSLAPQSKSRTTPPKETRPNTYRSGQRMEQAQPKYPDQTGIPQTPEGPDPSDADPASHRETPERAPARSAHLCGWLPRPPYTDRASADSASPQSGGGSLPALVRSPMVP